MSFLRRCCLVCASSGDALCGACARRLQPPPSTRVRGVGRVPALFAYDGVGATVIQALKYRDGRRLVGPLADAMAEAIADEVRTAGARACTWIPTTDRRRRARGFDQSELLALGVARRLRLPCVRGLRRLSPTAQTGRSRAERERNVGFDAAPIAGRISGPVIVIDDVCTTGATIRAARHALRDVGVDQVIFATVARTP